MKKSFIFLFILLIAGGVYAQPWLSYLPKDKKKKELSIFDYKKAFDEYYKNFDIKKDLGRNEGEENGEITGWFQFNRWYWNIEPQADKNGYLPNKSAWEIYQEYLSNSSVKQTKSSDWSCMGPYDSPGGYYGLGRLNCAAFDPADTNVLFVGAPSGGIWKTTDNGKTWVPLGDFNQSLGISDIALPSDYATSKTIYIATGDKDAWDNTSIGVLKSTDGGKTWQKTGLSFGLNEYVFVTRLLIDPKDNNTIIASTSVGVFKSTDAGATWKKLTDLSFIDMEYKPDNYGVLYGATQHGSVYVSVNSGKTWDRTLSTNGARTELAVSPANPNVVYALIANYQNGLYGVYKSLNAGASFSIVAGDNVNMLGWKADGSDKGGQGWYDLSLAVSPKNADIVLVGGVNTWRSTNGGYTFSIVAHWTGDGGAQEVHADVHKLIFSKLGKLIECNDGGVYLSYNNGKTYTCVSNGVMTSQIYKIGLNQQNPESIIAGLQDNGTKLRISGDWVDVLGGDGTDCAINPQDSLIQYGEQVYGTIYQTLNGWNSASKISPSGQYGAWVTPFILNPKHPKSIYVGYSDVFKSTNLGKNWTQISSFNSTSTLKALAVAPSDTNVIYAVSSQQVWRTSDNGENWTDVTNQLAGNYITNIAVKNDDPNTAWVTLGRYDQNVVYQTTDGGKTWTNISDGLPNIPAYTIVQDTQVDNEVMLYVGTQVGVFFKHGFANWEPYNKNLPDVKVNELEIYYDKKNPLNSRLRAATYGRGLWESPLYKDLNLPPSVQTLAPTDTDLTSITLNANIANDYSSTVTESGFVYSLSPDPKIGDPNTVKVVSSPTVSSGQYSIALNSLSPSTVYYEKSYAINGNGTGYGKQIIFHTSCSAGVTKFPLYEGLNSNAELGCWDIQTVVVKDPTKKPGFYYHTISLNPRILPTEGTKALKFNASQCSVGDMIRLASPILNTTGKVKLTLSFDWFNTKILSDKRDRAYIQYSLDGVNWITVDSVLRYSDEQGWKNVKVTMPSETYNVNQVYVGILFVSDGGRDCYLDNIIITVDKLSADATVKNYCAPTKGSVTLESNISGNQTFYLYDLTNTQIAKWSGDTTSHTFDNISDGTYYGKISFSTLTSPKTSNVTLNSESTQPTKQTSVSSDAQNICETTPVILSYSGGSGDEFVWYKDSLNNKIGVGNNFKVYPSDSAIYIGRWENACGVSDADTVHIAVVPATKIITQPQSVVVNVAKKVVFSVKAKGYNLSYQWYKNGNILSGATDSVYVIPHTYSTSSGIFYVDVNGQCGDVVSDQALLQIDLTAINEIKNKNFSVYPNPSSGIVKIKISDKALNSFIEISSIDGKKVFSSVLKDKKTSLNLSSLAKGTYLINIFNDKISYKKVLILK